MKLLVASIGAMLFHAHSAVCLAQAAPDRNVDRGQITAILARWEQAWNTHDMKAFGSMFHEDGTWILWTGAVWVGRPAIEDGHAEVHKTFFRRSIQRERLEELTFVGADAAVVRFCSTLIGDERGGTKHPLGGHCARLGVLCGASKG